MSPVFIAVMVVASLLLAFATGWLLAREAVMDDYGPLVGDLRRALAAASRREQNSLDTAESLRSHCERQQVRLDDTESLCSRAVGYISHSDRTGRAEVITRLQAEWDWALVDYADIAQLHELAEQPVEVDR